MKLVVTGATGYVGTEVIRQALSSDTVTSVIALARREMPVPENLLPGSNAAKFRSVTCEDFCNYSDSVKEQLVDVDGCIWLLAVTPMRSKLLDWKEVRKICFEYTVNGIETMSQLRRGKTTEPFRFMYASGANAQRDQDKKPWVHGDYSLMRGETETAVLKYAENSSGQVQSCIVKPGLVNQTNNPGILSKALVSVGSTVGVPYVGLSVFAAALIDQVVGGFEKETLRNDDLNRLGKAALSRKEA